MYIYREKKTYLRPKHKIFFPVHDDVIKWKHFPIYWPFVRGNSPVSGEFPAQRPVTRSFDVFFDLRLFKRLSKQREAGDLRRYRAHYDVTVSGQQCTSRELYTRFVLCIHIPNPFKFIFDCTFVLFIFVLFDPLNQSQTIPYQTILFLSILSI